MDQAEFKSLVERQMAVLPPWVQAKLGNLAVLVSDRAPEGGLLGLYEGPSLLERDPAAMEGPSRITLYQRAIEDEAWEEADLPRVVRETLAHEIGHHFGMSEAEIEVFEREWEKG